LLPNTPRGLNSSTTFVIDLADYKKAKRSRVLVRPRICALLETAEAFQRQLDTGVVNRRSQLADYHGLTRARVTQILNLLKLAPTLREFIRNPPLGGLAKPVTERQLRPLARLPHEKQIQACRLTMPGFLDFLLERPKRTS
jgi:hypothetical protein